jgi:uncharacterized RDD family membrane protein YckC
VPGLAQAPFAPTGPTLDNRRIGAALIDGAVVALIVLLLRALTGGLGAVTVLLAVAWALYYFFAFEWGADGQTIGKRLMGLRVVRENGGEAGVREVALRTALRIVDGIGFYVVGLAAMLATGERRQRIGDLVAGTVVTTAEAAAPAPAPVHAPEPEPQPEPVPAPPPVQPLPYEPETPPEPELPPAATVEIPTPPIADTPKGPTAPPPEPPLADPEPDVPVPPPPPQAARPEPPPAAPDVPVPPPPPPAEPASPPAEPQVRTEGIEIAPAIDLVMADEDEDAERREDEDAGPASPA